MADLLKVVTIDGVEQIVVERVETPKIEYRLYYDDTGKVLFYTCDRLEGNYIVVDQQTYSEMRYDWRVVDGKLTKLIPGIIISKLKPNKEGVICAKDDVSIIVNKSFKNKQTWKLNSYELR